MPGNSCRRPTPFSIRGPGSRASSSAPTSPRSEDTMSTPESAPPPVSAAGSKIVRTYVDYHKRHYVVRLANGREVDTAFPLHPTTGHNEASYDKATREEAIAVAEDLLPH